MLFFFEYVFHLIQRLLHFLRVFFSPSSLNLMLMFREDILARKNQFFHNKQIRLHLNAILFCKMDNGCKRDAILICSLRSILRLYTLCILVYTLHYSMQGLHCIVRTPSVEKYSRTNLKSE